MAAPALLTLKTGLPHNRYAQGDTAAKYIEILGQENRRARAIKMIFDRAGVGFRHMIIDQDYFREVRTTAARNKTYWDAAVPLGEDTIRRGLAEAGVDPRAIDDFIVVSCTGYHVPGLDLILAGRLGMRPDLQRTSVFGMGCYGAFPGLQRARHAAAAGRLALVLSLELCSVHMQYDDAAESVVSAALFSDGAGMALVGMMDEAPRAAPMPRLLHSATHCDYTTLEHMTFTVTDHGFRMYLSSYVPDLLSAQIEGFVDAMLAHCEIARGDVQHWGIHPGSTKIVDYVQQRLGLSDAQVEPSHKVLHEYGNMSSATILFVLDHIQQCNHPQPGEYGVLLAFGPGLTMEGLVLQW